MKKIYLLLIYTILLFSCNNNTQQIENTISEADFIGLWKLTELYTENGKVEGLINGFSVSGDAAVTGKNYNAQANFTNNPNKVTPTGDLTLEITVTVLGIPQTQEQTLDQIPNINGDWSYQDKILTISRDNIINSFTIVSINNTVLKLQSLFEENIEIQGNQAKVTGDLFITLEK